MNRRAPQPEVLAVSRLIQIRTPSMRGFAYRVTPTATRPMTSSRLVPSSREAFVAMVQPADLRDGDDSAVLPRLYGTRVRTVLVE